MSFAMCEFLWSGEMEPLAEEEIVRIEKHFEQEGKDIDQVKAFAWRIGSHHFGVLYFPIGEKKWWKLVEPFPGG